MQSPVDDPTPLPTNPAADTPEPIFQRIALSISGGGFRAAAYGLGTLKALHQLGLLDRVHMQSTISGGTLVGAFYALRRHRGEAFPKIYADFYSLLEQDAVLPEALTNWKNAISQPNQNYKLIRAFADVYHQRFYDQASFDTFWHPPANPSTALQTIVFGATELYTGLAFRFQYARFPTPPIADGSGLVRDPFFIGNGNVHISHERGRAVRLADIVAASSCFPVGFEPLELPDDFFPDDQGPVLFMDRNQHPLPIERLALIDGGVYDNQGLEALLLANKRNREYRKSVESGQPQSAGESVPLPTTVYLIADVASAERAIFEAEGITHHRDNSRSLRQWDSLFQVVQWSLIGVASAGIILSVGGGSGSFLTGLLTGLSVAGLGLLAVGRRAMGWLTGLFKNVDTQLYGQAMPPLRELTLRQLGYLLTVRMKTMTALLLSVFLRRVRSLNYGLLYQEEEESTTRETHHVIASIIGGILRDYEKPIHQSRLHPVYETIETAAGMGTTLWWQKDKFRLNAIIASAEITLAYRIIRFFERKRDQAVENRQPFDLHPDDQMIWDKAERLFDQHVNACQHYPVRHPDSLDPIE